MGEVIRPGAAAADIFSHARTAHTNAAARGGKWQEHAEKRLGPPIKLADLIDARYTAADAAYRPLAAQLKAMDGSADNLIGYSYDDLWNVVGRPSQDPSLSTLFPGGIAVYTDGPDEEQPYRMQLLAELLVLNVHPLIPPAVAQQHADKIGAVAKEYEALADKKAAAERTRDMLGRIRTAVARASQRELAALKRLYKAEGFSEADIHTVIPDAGRGGGGGSGGGGGGGGGGDSTGGGGGTP